MNGHSAWSDLLSPFFGCVMFGWFPGTDCVGTLLMDVLNVCVGVEAGGG